MICFPPCKINLGLHIVSKRPDGFHNLETCFYPVPWTDILEIVESDRLEFTSSGIPIPGETSTNLCLKAYRLMQQHYELPPVHIHLHKMIPMGAGLGGGSSDGAHLLRLLNEKFQLQVPIDELNRMAAQLGSDCAFFLYDAPRMGRGKGDELEAVSFSLKDKFLVIVKPDVHVATAEAYASTVPAIPAKALSSILSGPLEKWKQELKNDFEKSVSVKYPVISSIKETLYGAGAVYASMSGSGSSVFGLFHEAVNLKADFEGCTYWGGTLKV